MTDDFSHTWLAHLDRVILTGVKVAPRGKPTQELLQATIDVDMRRPVLKVEGRKLSYRFMAAEAFWILSGDDKVANIAPYNKNIARFSDDGETFYGAYGPKIQAQLPYVIDKLVEDPVSRQAGLTIWRENPPPTRDVPCTIAMFFSIRDGYLNNHTFMRSNDVWLGMPYDVFNFAMLGHLICAKLNQGRLTDSYVQPGRLFLTAASSHLYEEHGDQAIQCLMGREPISQGQTPKFLWQDPDMLMDWLKALRDTREGDVRRWWEAGESHAS